MDSQERLKATRSLNLLLFLLPQVCRNLLATVRFAQGYISDDALDQERAIFAQQEELLGEFYKAVAVMSHDAWDKAEESLQALIARCETLDAALSKECKERELRDYQDRLKAAELRAAENPLSQLATMDETLRQLEKASGLSEGEDPHDKEK